MIDILLPELGEGISNVEIRDVLVKKGDSIKKDQVILVLETDKASMEIPSEHDGVISELYIKTGDKISPNEKYSILCVYNMQYCFKHYYNTIFLFDKKHCNQYPC